LAQLDIVEEVVLDRVQVHLIPSQFFGSADFIKARPAMTHQTKE